MYFGRKPWIVNEKKLRIKFIEKKEKILPAAKGRAHTPFRPIVALLKFPTVCAKIWH